MTASTGPVLLLVAAADTAVAMAVAAVTTTTIVVDLLVATARVVTATDLLLAGTIVKTVATAATAVADVLHPHLAHVALRLTTTLLVAVIRMTPTAHPHPAENLVESPVEEIMQAAAHLMALNPTAMVVPEEVVATTVTEAARLPHPRGTGAQGVAVATKAVMSAEATGDYFHSSLLDMIFLSCFGPCLHM